MSLLISEDEAKERLEACEVVYKRLGRGNGSGGGYKRENGTFDRVPPFLKEVMGGEVRAGRKATDVAKDYGVSARSVLNFSEGRRNQLELKGSDSELSAGADRVADSLREKLVDKTVSKLMAAMEGVNITKYNDDTPVNQSIVARNLAASLEKIEGRSANGNGNQNNIQFNVHVPAVRELTDFGVPIRVVEKTGVDK